jgi:succinate dehydrogenase / fumarate reductase cytochrome b subunit
MNQKRPVNLDLTTLSFPVTAITSIMHRLSGIAVFLLLPYMFYLLQLSLHTEQGFVDVQSMMQNGLHKLLVWLFVSALFYHFMAGVRHIISDFGYGETIVTAKKTANILLLLTVISTIGLGVWLW